MGHKRDARRVIEYLLMHQNGGSVARAHVDHVPINGIIEVAIQDVCS